LEFPLERGKPPRGDVVRPRWVKKELLWGERKEGDLADERLPARGKKGGETECNLRWGKGKKRKEGGLHSDGAGWGVAFIHGGKKKEKEKGGERPCP